MPYTHNRLFCSTLDRLQPLRRQCGGGGGKAVLTLLAAAVPVGAIVAISNNDDSPTPAAAGGGNNNGGGVPQSTTSFLANLPSTATDVISSQSATRQVRVSNNRVTLAGENYVFTQAPTSQGYLISENNELLIARTATTGIRFLTLYVGEQLNSNSATFTSFDFIEHVPNNFVRTTAQNTPGGIVSYAGEYHISQLPSGAVATGLSEGTFAIDVNFGFVDNAISGSATSGSNMVGEFSGGTLDAGTFSSLTFTGAGSLNGMTADLSGQLFGGYANEFLATGTLGTTAAIGLVGTSQEIDFIEHIEIASESVTSSATVSRSVQRTAADSTSITLAGTQYDFASITSTAGQIVSTDGNLLLRKYEGENVGLQFFGTGTNLNSNGAISTFDILSYRTVNRTVGGTNGNLPSAAVTYSGSYIVASSTAGFNSGSLEMTVDFTVTDRTMAAFSGTTTDRSGAKSGDFDGGRISNFTTGIIFNNLSFTGTGSLDNVDFTNIDGEFVGTNPDEFHATRSQNNAIIGLIGRAN